MRHRKKVLIQSKYYSLSRSVHPKTKRASYFIHFDRWACKGLSNDDMAALRYHFDPAGNRGSSNSWTWRYRTKAEAEHLLSMAILRWTK